MLTSTFRGSENSETFGAITKQDMHEYMSIINFTVKCNLITFNYN